MPNLSTQQRRSAMKKLRELIGPIFDDVDRPAEHEVEVQEALDTLVHDELSTEASSINNRGWEAQLEFLLDRWGPKALEKEVREIVEDIHAE